MIKSICFVLLGFLAFIPAALFAGGEEGPEVRLPNERTVYVPKKVNARSLSKTNAALSSFFAENPSWQMATNDFTPNPHRAWGVGIQVPGYSSINATNAAEAGMAFIRVQQNVLSAQPEQLKLVFADIANGKAYVRYMQQYKGIDVLQSFVDLRMSLDGKVFLFGSDYHPSINLDVNPAIAFNAAREFAKAGLQYSPSNDNVEGGQLLILPLTYADHIEYHLVYNFRITTSPEEIWDTYLDAQSGKVLWRRNLVTFFASGDEKPTGASSPVTGRVIMNIYPKSYLFGASDAPMKNAYVNIDGKMYLTDENGNFTADLGGSTTAKLIVKLSGPYAIGKRIDSSIAANAAQSMTVAAGQNVEIRWDSTNSSAEERNSFYNLAVAHDFIRAIDPSDKIKGLDYQVVGLVNQTTMTCNAAWDGKKINFYKETSQCANTALIADVGYHEYGHAINQMMYGGTPTCEALSEATADINAFCIVDDPQLGPGFLIGSANNGTIRNADNTKHYPEDSYVEYHDVGQILTGCVWDVRKALGLDLTKTLSHFCKYGRPDASNIGTAFTDYLYEFLVADDDDANLANGTPHSAAILAAFQKHGIPAACLSISHPPLADQSNTLQAYPIQGSVWIDSNLPSDFISVKEVKVVYSLDNFNTTQEFPVSYDPSTLNFTGNFPPQPIGSIVRYYISAKNNFDAQVTAPAGAPGDNYLFLVGFVSKYFYNCEVTDGWTSRLDAKTGQWERAKPIGTWNSQLGTPPDVPYVQPDWDHTTAATTKLGKCWVTANGVVGGALGDDDVDEGETLLTTKSFDLTSYVNPYIRYYRWYSNNSGQDPNNDAWIVQISPDNGSTWVEVEHTLQSKASWFPIVFRVKDILAPTAKMKVQFVASDTGDATHQSLVEAAVDDFEILDTAEPQVDVDGQDGLTASIQLQQNYPNPFNPVTTISYSLPSNANVTVKVYSPLGKEIAQLAGGMKSAGAYRVVFDGSGFAPGIYVCELIAGNMRLTKKMTLLK